MPVSHMHVRGLVLIIVTALLTAGPAAAAPYWVAWEGNDYPENEGWERNIGPGVGSQRSIQGGILTLDSLAPEAVEDFYVMSRSIDPDPGESFVFEWRARFDMVAPRTDPGIAVFTDSAMSVAFEFANAEIRSVFERGVKAGFEPGVFHEFELRSTDMRRYDLRIDGALALSGDFVEVVTTSEVGWGDVIQGAQSISEWDYVRFGTVPEPASGAIFAIWLVGRTYRRSSLRVGMNSGLGDAAR